MLLKRSKEYIKNVDHMVINHNIATVIEFIFCKMRVWKGYFCNWFRKNWPTLTSSPHWTTTKYWILPFLVPPTRISEKIPPPINMSRLKSWFPLYKGGGGGRKLFLQLSWITWSGLAPFPGCQGSCGIVPNGPTGSVVFFNIRQGLKCWHVASTPTLTMWLLCSNCAFPWTTK